MHIYCNAFTNIKHCDKSHCNMVCTALIFETHSVHSVEDTPLFSSQRFNFILFFINIVYRYAECPSCMSELIAFKKFYYSVN